MPKRKKEMKANANRRDKRTGAARAHLGWGNQTMVVNANLLQLCLAAEWPHRG
jgi:hypothetical protein